MALVCALIGDIVGSRRHPDRKIVQRSLDRAVLEANRTFMPTQLVQPLEATVGDEFQAVFTTTADASRAALLLRLALLPDLDVRCGLGGGEVTIVDGSRRPYIQDGSAWWSAREALDELGLRRRSGLRTWYAGPDQDQTIAFLILRDTLVERLNDRGRRLLGGALRGRTQAELAAAEGINRSAVSQQFAKGVGAVVEAQWRFQAASTPRQADSV